MGATGQCARELDIREEALLELLACEGIVPEFRKPCRLERVDEPFEERVVRNTEVDVPVELANDRRRDMAVLSTGSRSDCKNVSPSVDSPRTLTIDSRPSASRR
jgi:hypothetical protein